LMPISAITKGFSFGPILRFAICMLSSSYIFFNIGPSPRKVNLIPDIE
jgi:hypothetical protein